MILILYIVRNFNYKAKVCMCLSLFLKARKPLNVAKSNIIIFY